ncbi:hypothetical protein MA16_Dca012702 [Dendrobium catenatum]|uniref:Uncharacterized protein n=1 Tax=Dendrobium catenatum TaxID=906689 RepID=A0A2I0WPP1_9ASPA|nr:hypothetical protein MA16_Dca012702 [Dendrobium catenatum]
MVEEESLAVAELVGCEGEEASLSVKETNKADSPLNQFRHRGLFATKVDLPPKIRVGCLDGFENQTAARIW